MRNQLTKKDFVRIARQATPPEGVKMAMDSVYQQILQRNRRKPMHTPTVSTARRTAALTLCLCLLVTGALAAAYLSANTDFFQTVFGRPSVEPVTEYDEDGGIIKNLPEMDRPGIGDEAGDALLGNYLSGTGETHTVQTSGGTLTAQVLGNVYDSTTGTGLLALTLERAGGFPELMIYDTDEAAFTGPGLRLLMSGYEAMYYDRANSTADKITLSIAYIQLDNTAPSLRLVEGILLTDLDEAALLTADEIEEEQAVFGLLDIPLTETGKMPSRTLLNNGKAAAHISAIGLKIDLSAAGYYNGADDFEVKTITLTFADTTPYTLMDREARVANYEYAIIPEDGSTVTFSFSRPVDVSTLQQVKINETILTVQE